jgi:hypothetical protein|mmetsp:Transcript_51806/g.83592  ORF Transcript_51806/g.83592 Transcript_51806/m.83592 type:complete len:326 (+) Transcript_51806:103-1080(+)
MMHTETHRVGDEFLYFDFPPALLRGDSGEVISDKGLPLHDAWHHIPHLSDGAHHHDHHNHHDHRNDEGAPWWYSDEKATKEMPSTTDTVPYECAHGILKKEDLHCRLHSVSALQLNDFADEMNDVKDDASSETCDAADTDSLADTESILSSEETEQKEPIDFEEYVLKHCKIRAKDLKSNALARMRDLRDLFAALQRKNIVRMIRSTDNAAPTSANVDSIFGFSMLFVDEIADFNDEITRMVRDDVAGCWHANGVRVLTQPTSTVYELLRQLGVHPVKGTRGSALQGTPSGTRDFMFYQQYAFNLERLQRNCLRLKIGVIGNRRT